MLTRRHFLALSAAATCAASLDAHAVSTRSGMEFGVQLFSVRNDLTDPAATFRLIHSIGYATIETYPLVYNRPAKELKSLIEGTGLRAPSGHFDYDTLEQHVDYAAELGVEYMVCPMLPRPLWDSIDGFKRAAVRLNIVAARARAAGLQFGYHPHSYEFRTIGGSNGFNVLMSEFDPSIRLELDIYWATEAGQHPIELMRRHRDRLALIHIKDRKPAATFTYDPMSADSHHFTEAGSGTIDWKANLGEARSLGVRQFFVDQDGTDLPIAESLRMNWKYLSQLSF